jgi:hypothetical protein
LKFPLATVIGNVKEMWQISLFPLATEVLLPKMRVPLQKDPRNWEKQGRICMISIKLPSKIFNP